MDEYESRAVSEWLDGAADYEAQHRLAGKAKAFRDLRAFLSGMLQAAEKEVDALSRQPQPPQKRRF